MGSDGAEPANDSLPLAEIALPQKLHLQRDDGRQPQIGIGRLQHIVLPFGLTEIVQLDEPSPGEGRPDRAFPWFN